MAVQFGTSPIRLVLMVGSQRGVLGLARRLGPSRIAGNGSSGEPQTSREITNYSRLDLAFRDVCVNLVLVPKNGGSAASCYCLKI